MYVYAVLATVARDGDDHGPPYGHRYDNRRRHGDEEQTVLDHDVSSVTSQDQGTSSCSM